MMNAVQKEAERTLVAVCAHVSLSTTRHENFAVWLDVLRDILVDCGQCSLILVPIRTSASVLMNAQSREDQDAALYRLMLDIRTYYTVVAASRVEHWRGIKAHANVPA
ncbi:MAG: hypothetical protein ABJL99_10065 [Aliishimia sp.]